MHHCKCDEHERLLTYSARFYQESSCLSIDSRLKTSGMMGVDIRVAVLGYFVFVSKVIRHELCLMLILFIFNYLFCNA